MRPSKIQCDIIQVSCHCALTFICWPLLLCPETNQNIKYHSARMLCPKKINMVHWYLPQTFAWKTHRRQLIFNECSPFKKGWVEWWDFCLLWFYLILSLTCAVWWGKLPSTSSHTKFYIVLICHTPSAHLL